MEMTCEAIARKGTMGYASDAENNGLFSVNLETREATFLQLFPGELPGKRRIHCCAKWIGEKVFFVPASGSHIFVWEIEGGKMVSLPVPDPDVKLGTTYSHKLKFRDAVEWDGALWCIPDTYPSTIKVDLATYQTALCEVPPELCGVPPEVCEAAAEEGVPSENGKATDDEKGTATAEAGQCRFAIKNVQECHRALVKAAVETKSILRESDSLGLTDWLCVITEEGMR